MAAQRLRVRQIRNVLKLHYENGLPQREIARVCGIGNGTVAECLRRARKVGLVWPLPEELTDEALEQQLYRSGDASEVAKAQPDLASIHRELFRPGVTLQLLWVEYRDVHPDGYGYSRFCELYQRFRNKPHPTMRQVHPAGKKTFVDYSGKKSTIVDPTPGEIEDVELFVGVLGASTYFYAEATRTQSLPDWIGSHNRMNEFFGGSSEIYVTDNLKSGVVTDELKIAMRVVSEDTQPLPSAVRAVDLSRNRIEGKTRSSVPQSTSRARRVRPDQHDRHERPGAAVSALHAGSEARFPVSHGAAPRRQRPRRRAVQLRR